MDATEATPIAAPGLARKIGLAWAALAWEGHPSNTGDTKSQATVPRRRGQAKGKPGCFPCANRLIIAVASKATNHSPAETERLVPELPEVETVVRELRPLLLGRRLKTIAVSRHPLRKPWQREWVSLLRGRRVAQVRRRGKWIILDLEHNMHLVIHLGMTGQLTVAPRRQPSAAHTHLVFSLDRGRHELRFRDVRRFGSATVFQDGEHLDSFFADTRLGPEPFDLRPRYWRQQLAKTSRCLKAVLLDQCVVAGVGNIYADEALFQARLQPVQRGWHTTADIRGKSGFFRLKWLTISRAMRIASSSSSAR